MAGYRVEIVAAKCQSNGKCIATAPQVFAWRDDRKAQVIDPAGAADELILKAAKSCPYRAIVVADPSSGTQLFPPPRKV
jgi:ferredoxin